MGSGSKGKALSLLTNISAVDTDRVSRYGTNKIGTPCLIGRLILRRLYYTFVGIFQSNTFLLVR